MMMTDGRRTVEIEMRTWDGNNYSPDWSVDFFSAPYDEEKEMYVVEDVGYCIEQAEDWKNGIGDYVEEFPNPEIEKIVDVEDIK